MTALFLFLPQQHLSNTVVDAPWQRPDNLGWIGFGQCYPPGVGRATGTGCYKNWCDLLWALRDRMQNLAFELEDDAVKFPTAIHAIKERDEEARTRFEYMAYAMGDDYGHPELR